MRAYVFLFSPLILPVLGLADGTFVQTPYQPPKVVFEFYLDDPQKIGSALYWIRSLIHPLMEAPYNYSPEQMNIKVVIHGAEIVTLAKKNEMKYKDAVERMRYYADLGVEIKVCGQAAQDFGYRVQDFQPFVQVVPNAITELAHWQQQGYALIKPEITSKQFPIETIR